MEHSAANQQIAQLVPGMHIATPRRGYTHHGIYVGNGRVIHYAGMSNILRNGPVEEVSIEAFADGRGWSVQQSSFSLFSRSEVVRRARSRVGENHYQLVTNNCEHFCVWCRAGYGRSEQVEAWRTRLGLTSASNGWRRAVRCTGALRAALTGPGSGPVSS